MTKFLTAAAWSALIFGGTAFADTPPSESSEVATEDAATEMDSEMKTIRYGDEAEADVEAEATGIIANVTVEGEMDAEAEGDDLEEAADEDAAPEADY